MASGVRAGEAAALGAPRVDELVERAVETREHGSVAGFARGLVLDTFGDLEDAAQRKQPFHAQGSEVAARPQPLGDGNDLGERRLVDAQLRAATVARDVEADRDVATGQPCSDPLAQARLERVMAGRQPETHVEALAIDAAHVPAP